MKDVKIISIGGELVRGEILNTNAQYIADLLTRKGMPVSSILTLPDDYEQAVGSMKNALKGPGVYIITGGLGGTGDDLTRKIVSEVLNAGLVVDERGKKNLQKRYNKRGKSLTRADLMQAALPEGGKLLENRYGLAYGFSVEDLGKSVFCLPGVPREMKWMFEHEVVPALERSGAFDPRYTCALLIFAGIGEYVLDRRVRAIVSRYKGILYGTRAGYGITKVVLESRETGLRRCVGEIEAALERFLVSKNEMLLEEVIGSLLAERGLTLSVAESCTGGYIAKTITDVPGSSRYFLGGVVSYSNDVKRLVLGVSPATLEKYGAVSNETAVEMAEGTLSRFGSDIAISVTGIAGPDGGTSKKPVGTVYICILRKGETPIVGENLFTGDREIVRYRSVFQALYMLFLILRGYDTQEKTG